MSNLHIQPIAPDPVGGLTWPPRTEVGGAGTMPSIEFWKGSPAGSEALTVPSITPWLTPPLRSLFEESWRTETSQPLYSLSNAVGTEPSPQQAVQKVQGAIQRQACVRGATELHTGRPGAIRVRLKYKGQTGPLPIDPEEILSLDVGDSVPTMEAELPISHAKVLRARVRSVNSAPPLPSDLFCGD